VGPESDWNTKEDFDMPWWENRRFIVGALTT
jgi:hypothetical protein